MERPNAAAMVPDTPAESRGQVADRLGVLNRGERLQVPVLGGLRDLELVQIGDSLAQMLPTLRASGLPFGARKSLNRAASLIVVSTLSTLLSSTYISIRLPGALRTPLQVADRIGVPLGCARRSASHPNSRTQHGADLIAVQCRHLRQHRSSARSC